VLCCAAKRRNLGNTFKEGLEPGTIVEVRHAGIPKEHWYMRITDGRVQGPSDDPSLVGAQWMKTNSRNSPDLTIAITKCHIRTIIETFNSNK
jgi:hypothetical protein